MVCHDIRDCLAVARIALTMGPVGVEKRRIAGISNKGKLHFYSSPGPAQASAGIARINCEDYFGW